MRYRKLSRLSGLLVATLAAARPASSVAAMSGSAPAPTPRSLWVWDTASIRADGATQTDFLRFLAAPHGEAKNAITTVYFDGVNARQLADAAIVRDLRRFLKSAHARELRVDFLTGDPHWATPAEQAAALAELNAILAFNRSGGPGEQFDGFQYDVEPHTLPEWPSPALREGILDLLDRSRAAIQASGQRLLLTAAIPSWYDQPQLGFLDRAIIDRTDEVVIMDYVRTADRLVNDASGELDHATKAGKKIWIGVETGELKDTPEISFFGTGNAALEGVLAEALPRLTRQRSFAGYAIHHWASYVTLKP
ncbi:hypothetical protein [Sorangium sp. So ce1389]|uniref:hypothetical protein n=1 Tax=Sorangium sp. So ce1389 TaxID=3133336 RepID=UPI003F5D65F3